MLLLHDKRLFVVTIFFSENNEFETIRFFFSEGKFEFCISSKRWWIFISFLEGKRKLCNSCRPRKQSDEWCGCLIRLIGSGLKIFCNSYLCCHFPLHICILHSLGPVFSFDFFLLFLIVFFWDITSEWNNCPIHMYEDLLCI